MRALVAYGSKHGATRGIADAIVERLRERGVGAEAAPVEEVDDPRGYDAVVLGSAIYAGSWLKPAVEFVEHHRDVLEHVPVWLFSSGPLGSDVEDTEDQPKQLAKLQEELHPKGYRLFYGALYHERLSFSERMMVKAVRAPQGDFRDWEGIGRWADEIAETLAATSA
jgi:menaquinone-dependent protoporphyrinogen oxidase